MKRVVILGASGTVGKKALNYVLSNPDALQCVGLSAHTAYNNLIIPANCIGLNTSEPYNFDLFIELTKPDIVLNAISGFNGLRFSLSIIQKGIPLALANKESVVCGGKYLMTQSKKHNSIIIPVDSEHNSLFKLLKTHTGTLESVTITASGGPFLHRHDLAGITPEEAVNHPVWPMGNKISIDSATLVNKMLEKIEAMYLFQIPFAKINCIIEPTSHIHAYITNSDGTISADVYPPDMIYPISYALQYPNEDPLYKSTLVHDISNYTFITIDTNKYRIFSLIKESDLYYASVPIVLNAANEVAVDLFLHNTISFLQIYDMIVYALEHSQKSHPDTYEDIELIHNQTVKLIQYYAKQL